ncbi:MAG: uroporphyrinogen decarboxylase [Peptococcaceae bacterium]|nr:uroporphyrinogen decarboxylase [Peptococcaceae bacterium]
MINSALYQERKTRITKAIALEKPDRTPVVLGVAAFAATASNMSLADFVSDLDNATKAMLQTFDMFDADSFDHGTFCTSSLSYLWLSKVKLPGVELPENSLWQVQENELMTIEDYDLIINEGWPKFYETFMRERIGNGVPERFARFVGATKSVIDLWAEHDAFPMNAGVFTTPYEMFCGGRSMTKFIMDLYKIPDKVQAAMDAAAPYMIGPALELVKQAGGFGVWIGGWRSAGSLLSKKLWERFLYPYYEKLVYEVDQAGIVPILHLDSDWTRDLDRFRSLPKGKCILATDGETDLYKAKEILGDHMCLMGDVPAALLTVGTPDEVYNYSRKLIEDLGPNGFILHSGCDVPFNAKIENVRAMIAAATGK